MEFSNEQKLIVTLLTEIHSKLEIEDGLDPDFVQRAVVNNQGWALEWKYPGVFEETHSDPQEVRFVGDVLEMWSRLEMSFNALDAAGRADLVAAVPHFGGNVSFPGFDGNNEHEYLAIAKIFVDDLERWTEFSGRILNSHMRTADAYLRMLGVFEDIVSRNSSNGNYGPLSVEELTQVLRERTHPENR
ncbi:hypothetical protein PMM47T1_13915 [Pseudomonas sp. M47T1]|uniref:YfbU family protein n=1 Tax=Pseudomonas sp. M47T1 TaxID=1179778 RepID=UPI00026085F2|nr:YfbU family protein [Pseudomonas sp. M47T1]EIK96061.1 hypothetical protein PMM47T1_13915 [Pseudomonas sp. M47T1]